MSITVAAAWNGPVGQHWATYPDRYDAMVAGFDQALFDTAAIGTEDRVLDIGCGSGATTRLAAARASWGRVTGVDISVPLLDRAGELTDPQEYPQIEYVLGDAQVHPFPAGGYDVALSRGGVMFFADDTAAFSNIGRALRPGGRLAFIVPRPVFPDGEEREALGRLASLLGNDHATEGAVAAAMGSLSNPERVQEVLADAGFRDVRLEPVTAPTYWGKNVADAVEFFISRTPGAAVSDTTRAAMTAALLPHESDQGVRLRAGVWVVSARKPR